MLYGGLKSGLLGGSLFGRNVYIDRMGLTLVPVLRVQENVPMTDEGRGKMNKWLLDTFGEEDRVITAGDKIFVSPAMFEKLKKEVLK